MSLLPKAEELRSGATKAAREILAVLSQGSVVVVDHGRAEAVLVEVLIAARVLGAQGTARTIAGLLEEIRHGAEGKANPFAVQALKSAVEVVREAYEVKP